MSLHLAIDMDGVLLDFSAGICNSILTEYGVDLQPEDITEWDLHSILDPIIGQSWWKWMRARDWLWPNFPAVDGAIGAVDKLHRDGHYLEIVTAKPEWATFAVWKWLGKWRPMVDRVTIVGTEEPKHLATDADVLIDDKPSNCEGWVDNDPNRSAILFDQPYNDNVLCAVPIYRGLGWQETLNIIGRLAA